MSKTYGKSKNFIANRIKSIVQKPSFGGLLLILSVAAAIFLSNSPYQRHYFDFVEMPITISIGSYVNTHSLSHVINDGLMVFFFFLVGLEIKREILVGHLQKLRLALFPVISALGGVLAPAVLYSFMPHDSLTAAGWAIPTATDIAFSLAVLSLIGSSVPTGLKVFLTTLAIADDIFGIIIIGVLYTTELNITAITAAALLLSCMYLLNRAGIRSTFAYTILSFLVWAAVAKSGIHPTIAGVLTAITIPVLPKLPFKNYLETSQSHWEKLNASDYEKTNVLTNKPVQDSLFTLGNLSQKALTPLTKMEAALTPCVHFMILPLFAFANAGVAFSADTPIISSVSIGVFTGLFIGKPLGIYSAARLTALLKIALPPNDVTWKHIFGAGIVAGIGFTIAMFMTSLIFGNAPTADAAKIGVVTGSLASAVIGLLFLKYACKN